MKDSGDLPILPDVDVQLTDAEFDWLDAFLERLRGGHGPELSLVDGFLTAIAIAPADVEQDEWIRAVVGDFGDAFADIQEAVTAINLLERRRVEVLTKLEAQPAAFLPMIDILEDETPAPEAWCDGFVRGVEYQRDAWEPILAHPAGSAAFVPFVALADEDVLAEMEPRKRRRWHLTLLLTASLPEMIVALYQLSRLFREDGNLDKASPLEDFISPDSDEDDMVLEPHLKVGRNDPCPCGSGKKFKKCCGSNA